MSRNRSFSFGWMLASMALFIVVEILLGVLVGKVVVGRYISIPLSFTIQGLLHLASFLVGGFVIGSISPGIRISEPAAGAFGAVGLMLVLTVFTPYNFIAFSTSKLIVGGLIACVLAMIGATVGERMMGNR